MTKLEDARIAIECFERIARFHILALHQMATPESQQQARKAEITYDPQQEREQLDRTLLSLLQYYDDYRGRLDLTNEAEFRSYCVIFQLDSAQTDTEDRVQTWPRNLLNDRKVQAALQLFAAACTTIRRLGPFKALATEHVVARQDWESFWKLLNSTKISYLQACVAEIYFHLLRNTVLRSIVRALRVSKAVNGRYSPTTDWSMHDLRDLFHFDDDDQLVAFCSLYDLEFHQVGDEDYLDLSPVAGKTLQTPNFRKSIQESTWVVEQKRHGRSLAAVIDGMNVQQALDASMVDETDGNEEMADVEGHQETNGSGDEDPESLFIPEAPANNNAAAQPPSIVPVPKFTAASPFGAAGRESGGAFAPSNKAAFGQPSGGLSLNQPAAFGQPTSSTSVFSQAKLAGADEKKSTFNFLGAATPEAASATTTTSTGPFAFPSMTSVSLPGAGGSSSITATINDKSTSGEFASTTEGTAINTIPGLFAPKQDTPPGAGLTTPFKPATTENPFLTTTASPQEKRPVPSFSFSKPEHSQNVPSLFSGLAPAAPSISAADETNFKPPAAQSHFTAPSPTPVNAQAPPSHGGQDTSGTNGAGSQSPPRRSSINNLPDTKPKKPSPLSHSVTFSEDSSSLGGAPQIKRTPATQVVEELFPGRQKTSLPQSFTQTKSIAQPNTAQQQAQPNFDVVLTRISEELTTDPVSGFLKQYVDYTVKQVITKVQEDLYWERMNSEADEFRSWFLQDKFGKRWRETCRRQRLAKQGRERRKRAQKRLHESHMSDAYDYQDIRDASSRACSSRMGSVASHQSKREMVDTMYKSTIDFDRPYSDRQAQAGSKRSVSSHADSVLPSTENGHKRMKSTSHVDDHGLVGKPQAFSNARSSFLNFSLATTAQHRSSTTKSPYFRMKALGVKPSGDSALGISRGTKRQRSDSLEWEQRSRLSSPLLGSSPDQRGNDEIMGPPSSRSMRSKTIDDDEALFARLRAAREGLRESGVFMRSEVEKDGELRRSASSLSDRESPSLARARADVRIQAARADSDFGASLSGREVPAYRLRESRFVPREHYPRALERASEILASRSMQASTSRPGAERLGIQGSSSFNVDANPSFDALSPLQPQPASRAVTNNARNGVSATSELSPSAATAVRSRGNDEDLTGFDGAVFATNSSLFSQTPAPAEPIVNEVPNPFLEDSWIRGSENPVLQAPIVNSSLPALAHTSSFSMPPFHVQTNSFSSAASQPPQDPGYGTALNIVHDNSIQPAEIDDALSRSFSRPAESLQTGSSRAFGAHSKAVSVLSEEGGSASEPHGEAEHPNNQMDQEHSHDDDSASDESMQFNPNASANRFAMLVDADEEYESQESASEGQPTIQQVGQDDVESSEHDEQTEPHPDIPQYDNDASDDYESVGGEGSDGENGAAQILDRAGSNENGDFDSEEEAEDAEDEMEYDSEEGSYDEDVEDGRVFVPQATFGYQRPQPNEALQIVGNNVEEAIELSD